MEHVPLEEDNKEDNKDEDKDKDKEDKEERVVRVHTATYRHWLPDV